MEDAGEAARQLGIAASNWGDQQVKTAQGSQVHKVIQLRVEGLSIRVQGQLPGSLLPAWCANLLRGLTCWQSSCQRTCSPLLLQMCSSAILVAGG